MKFKKGDKVRVNEASTKYVGLEGEVIIRGNSTLPIYVKLSNDVKHWFKESVLDPIQEESVEWEVLESITLAKICHSAVCAQDYLDLCKELEPISFREVIGLSTLQQAAEKLGHTGTGRGMDWLAVKGFIREKEKEFEAFEFTIHIDSVNKLKELYFRFGAAPAMLKNYYSTRMKELNLPSFPTKWEYHGQDDSLCTQIYNIIRERGIK